MARHLHRPLTPEQARRRTWTYVGAGCGGALLLALLIGAIMITRLTGGPALPPDIQQRAAAEAGAPSSTTSGASVTGAGPAGGAQPGKPPPLKQQMASVEAAVRNGQRAPVTLYINDSELNQVIAGSVRGKEIRSARAYFGAGKVYMVLKADWRGRDVNLTVTAEPVIVNGSLRFGVESVKVGSMGAPAALVSRIQQGLNEHQDQWGPAKTGVYFESAEVTTGRATLRGHTVGRR